MYLSLRLSSKGMYLFLHTCELDDFFLFLFPYFKILHFFLIHRNYCFFFILCSLFLTIFPLFFLLITIFDGITPAFLHLILQYYKNRVGTCSGNLWYLHKHKSIRYLKFEYLGLPHHVCQETCLHTH